MNKRAGLLLPRSAIYPSISFDIMGGLRYGLSDKGIKDVEIKTESTGIGADNKLIYAACEKLLFDGCTIVAGYVNPSTAEMLEPLFAGANAIFLSLDAGYHFPTLSIKPPHVFYLSLQGALCCRITAKTATADGWKNFAFTCSFYDAGYRSPHAYARGLEEGGGGITFNQVTKLKRSEFTLEPLAQHLERNSNDAILASFCGDMMQDFCAAAATGDVFKNHSVYGSSFMGDEQWLEQCVYPGVDIKTCVPWAGKLDNASNKHFTQTLTENNQKINIFSLLGWEAAAVMATAFEAGGANAAISKLEGLEFNSPRGVITLDKNTHRSVAPVYEAWIRKNEDTGNCILETIQESPYTEEQRKNLETDINNFTGSATSWFNAYACLES